MSDDVVALICKFAWEMPIQVNDTKKKKLVSHY